MFSITRPRAVASAAALVGVLVAATGAGGAVAAAPHTGERLVVRGDATVVDGPCAAGACRLELSGGAFRGTAGSGAYRGTLTLRLAEAFANGEGGVCAPVDGRVVLGAGSPDRLVLAVAGASCQDGAGPVTAASFTGLARFTVTRAAGKHAGATGHGVATFLEDAADHDRMTLIGRLSR